MVVRKYEIYFKCWPGYLTSEQSEYNNNNNNKTDILPG